MLNICLLYTTYHSYLWDKISEQNPSEKEILILNFSKRKTKSRKNQKVLFSRSSSSKYKIIKECIKIAATCKIKKFKLTIPHPDHLLGNFLFFNKNVKEITLIEDGILNYYKNPNRDPGILTRQKKRQRITLLTPFRYQAYSGHLSGIDSLPPKTIKGYFHDPELIVEKSKFKEIKKIHTDKESKNQKKEKTLIIIEQPLESFLSKELALQLREKARKLIEGNFSEIYTKKHPEHLDSIQTITQQTKETALDNSLPIEEQIGIINPSHVIGFTSTALINIKRANKETTCISIGLNEILKENKNISNLKQLFEKSGVEIH